jgi:uncharacterized protein with beta-barrel porin domain
MLVMSGRRVGNPVRACTVCLGVSLTAGQMSEAIAANECGVGTNVTCTSAGNPYTLGITYANNNQTVNLLSGVSASGFVGITLNGGGTETLNLASGVVVNPSFGNAISITNAAGGLSINGDGSSITATGGTGISAVSTAGPISITTGSVTSGNGTGIGARVQSGNGSIVVTANGPVSGTAGGINAVAQGTGAVSVTAKSVSTSADNAGGVFAQSSGGTVTVNTTGGTVSTSGAAASGVTATFNGSSGAATVTTGDINTQGNLSIGVAGFRGGPNAALSIDTRAGTIHTLGSNATGINAVTGSFPGSANAGTLTIQAGNITAGNAGGIVASANGGAINIIASGAINSSGDGINTQNVSTGASVTTSINVTGSIATSGAFANGISANVLFGGVNVTTISGAVASNGASGAGVFSSGDADTVVVTSTGKVSGDTGVQIANGGPATVTNAGTITGNAGTAIQIFGSSDSTYTNRGTVNGNVAMGGGNDLVVLYTQSVNNGVIDGESGTNTLRLAGTTTGSIDLSKLLNFQLAEKTDTGIWTLVGTGGFSTSTTVSNGTLNVNSTLTTPTLTVSPGATLGGSGTIIGKTTVNGGTLSPGNSPGAIDTINIQGSLVFTTAATYLVQISGSVSDKAVVTGTATLAGNVVVQPLTRISSTTTYVILTGGNLSGNFAGVSFLSPSNLARNPRLADVGNEVVLTLDPGLLSPILPAGANVNQRNVATAIDNAIVAGANPSGGLNMLFNLAGPNLLNALTQASGEIATRSQQTTFEAMNLFIGLITDPFMQRNGADSTPGTTGYAEGGDASAHSASKRTDAFTMFTKAPPRTFEQRWSVWAAAFGGSQSSEGNAMVGSNNTTSSIAGTAVGADYLLSPHTVAGFALAGGGTSFSVANGGTGRSDLFQAGAYLRHTNGPAYVSAALAYGWQDVTTDRSVMIAGSDHLRAEFNANAWSGRVEGGYRFVAPRTDGIGITPYAACQFTTFELPAYAEQVISGTPSFALSYVAKSVTDTRTELGIRTDKSFAMTNGVLTLRGRIAWAHDFDPDRNIAATFQALQGASFVVNGAAQARDSALTTASAEMKWVNGWSAAATFEGSFSNVTRSYAGKSVVR